MILFGQLDLGRGDPAGSFVESEDRILNAWLETPRAPSRDGTSTALQHFNKQATGRSQEASPALAKVNVT